MFIFISLSSRASRCSLKFMSSKLVYKINVSLIILSFYFLPSFSDKRTDSSILGSSLKPYQTGVFRENVTIVLRTFKVNMLVIINPSRTTDIQLFRERLSEKVHATIPKGIVGSFEFTLLQRNLKEWHEMPMGICLRVLKENNKRRFDSYSVRNSVLIISHITFRYCPVQIFPTTFLEIAVFDPPKEVRARQKSKL